MFDAAQQYLSDLRLFLEVLAFAMVLNAIAVLLVGGVLAFFLHRLTETQRKRGTHQVWMAQQTFRPSPQTPFPPKSWEDL